MKNTRGEKRRSSVIMEPLLIVSNFEVFSRKPRGKRAARSTNLIAAAVRNLVRNCLFDLLRKEAPGQNKKQLDLETSSPSYVFF